MAELNWKGVYPAVLTPFKENGEIDFDMFAKNTEAQIEAGVHGIIIAGSLGDAAVLDTDEKFELLTYAIQVIAGRVPVILSIAENTTKNAINFAVKAKELGADGVQMV